MTKFSLPYKILRFFGLSFSEKEYGGISFGKLMAKAYQKYRNAFISKYLLHLVMFSPINARSIRPKLWRRMGCTVGKKVFIGEQVLLDITNADLIHLEDGVHIAARSIILCHQRDLSEYCVGSDYGKLPYVRKKVHLKQGCLIGTQSMLMPGVTIGEGAIVGAFSLVTKDVPPWTIATGRPARVVKKIKPAEKKTKQRINHKS